jgi:hypothetical protein
MNTREKAANNIEMFLKSEKNVMLLTGTHSQQKHKLALQIVNATLPAPKVLFRTNNKLHGENMSGFSYLDTFNVASQKKTPNDLDVAVVWPIDPLTADKGGVLMSDLQSRGVKKVILCTWLDNQDLTWLDSYKPEKVIYNAEDENAAHHETMEKIASNKRIIVPSNLPAYAKDADPRYLVRLHCDKCNTGRWAKMNKPFPGKDILLNSEMGAYKAVCLKCGTETDDSHNWFGQT